MLHVKKIFRFQSRELQFPEQDMPMPDWDATTEDAPETMEKFVVKVDPEPSQISLPPHLASRMSQLVSNQRTECFQLANGFAMTKIESLRFTNKRCTKM
jgi:hypothetical protein